MTIENMLKTVEYRTYGDELSGIVASVELGDRVFSGYSPTNCKADALEQLKIELEEWQNIFNKESK